MKFQDKEIKIRKLAPSDIGQPEKFQKFTNSLVAEDAMILVKTKKSKKDREEWLRGKISKVKKHKVVYLVAECDGEIVGTCNAELLREKMDHISGFGIGIKKEFRGIGLGKYLMQEVIKLARTELKPRPKIIELEVFETNKPAIALYKKMGFKQVAKVPNRIQYKGKLISEIIMHLKV